MDTNSERMRVPVLFQVGLWLTFFNTWVLFEETIVDRHGLWEYMPYYQVAHLCAWDIGAAILLAVLVWRAFRGRRSGSSKPAAVLE